MNYYIVYILIIILSFSACNDRNEISFLKKPEDATLDTTKALEIFHQLEEAYIKDNFDINPIELEELFIKYDNNQIDSLTYNELLNKFEDRFEKFEAKELQKFFEKWKEAIKSIPLNKHNDQIIKDIYDIHRLLFDPFDANKNEGLTFSLYGDIKYLLVPDRIDIFINTTRKDSSGEDVYDEFIIDNFRPELSFDEAEILHLTPEYKHAIDLFLWNKQIPTRKELFINEEKVEESFKREMYLSKYISIVYAHWGGFWHLETFPNMYKITFNQELDTAIGSYRIYYSGGEAVFINSSDEWRLINSGCYWVE